MAVTTEAGNQLGEPKPHPDFPCGDISELKTFSGQRSKQKTWNFHSELH